MGGTAYISSKPAVMLMKVFALEHGKDGFRTNCACHASVRRCSMEVREEDGGPARSPVSGTDYRERRDGHPRKKARRAGRRGEPSDLFSPRAGLLTSTVRWSSSTAINLFSWSKMRIRQSRIYGSAERDAARNGPDIGRGEPVRL